MTLNSFSFSVHDLYTRDGLLGLDLKFQNVLSQSRPELLTYMLNNRGKKLEGIEYSKWLIDSAIILDGFLRTRFDSTNKESNAPNLALVYLCNNRFVRKRALGTYGAAEAKNFDGNALKEQIEQKTQSSWQELKYAIEAMNCIENEGNKISDEWADILMRYAAWAVHSDEGKEIHKNDTIFFLPTLIEISEECELDGHFLRAHKHIKRDNFSLTDQRVHNSSLAGYNANYCLFCHKRGNDSCSHGLNDASKGMISGCALEEKISEMNYVKSIGLDIGALAIIVVDNPLCAGTGHRICNDCSRACIYQKQKPVDIPLVETNVLSTVLDMQFGFEIYSLLTRWNPLNLLRPLPLPPTNGRVLITGMGPAGYTAAHYLINEGHTVVGVDGAKIEPLPERLIGKASKNKKIGFELIQDIKHEVFQDLDLRVASGFGGVSEYGITVRWDKNYLSIIRIILERRDSFLLAGEMMLGGNLHFEEILQDFDHVVVTCGSGKAKTINMKNCLASGVKYASDFLMNLHLGGAYRQDSIDNLQIRSPIVVIGGGLTAVDASTESLAYYSAQVKKFKERYSTIMEHGHKIDWTAREKAIVADFLSGQEPEVTMVYRQDIANSPAYQLNKEELVSALAEGIKILDNTILKKINLDALGDVESVTLQKKCKDKDVEIILPARTLMIAIGTEKNLFFVDNKNVYADDKGIIFFDEFFCNPSKTVSALGDLNPKYAGSVVKAMASAKHSYQSISQAINTRAHKRPDDLFYKITNYWSSYIIKNTILADGIIELQIRSPLAAKYFAPGQFYRLQNYHMNAPKFYGKFATTMAMEPIALTGSCVKDDVISLIVLETGGSSNICKELKVGEKISLMGPSGEATYISKNETVMLVGGGLGNVVAFSIGNALRLNGCKVIYFAGYRHAYERIKIKEIEDSCDIVVWACDNTLLSKSRPNDYSFECNVIDAINKYQDQKNNNILLYNVDRIITIGSCGMMNALRNFINKSSIFKSDCVKLASVNSPMQCMLKGLCGQCMQMVNGQVVFTCSCQDQNLMQLDFDVLRSRLQSNSVNEKVCTIWINEAFKQLES